MQNKQSAATPPQPLGMCEKLFNALSLSPSFRHIRSLSYQSKPDRPSPPSPVAEAVPPKPKQEPTAFAGYVGQQAEKSSGPQAEPKSGPRSSPNGGSLKPAASAPAPSARDKPDSGVGSGAIRTSDKTSAELGPKRDPAEQYKAQLMKIGTTVGTGPDPSPVPANEKSAPKSVPNPPPTGPPAKQDKAQLVKIGTAIGTGPAPSPAPANQKYEPKPVQKSPHTGLVSEGKAKMGQRIGAPGPVGDKERTGPPKTQPNINERVEEYINRAKTKIRTMSGVRDGSQSA